MISRNQIKFIQSLKHKKNRIKHGLFVVEGDKIVNEFLHSDWIVDKVYSTDKSKGIGEYISNKELNRISFLKTSNQSLALVKIPTQKNKIFGDLIIALDGISNPGNLGTIIRLADWFGVKTIMCSQDCVDVFNPKVVQSTMGSLSRLNICYVDLINELNRMHKYKIIAAVMNGDNIFETPSKKNQIIVFGNESSGLREDVLNLCTTKITIPKSTNSIADSLNVANACAIFLAHFR